MILGLEHIHAQGIVYRDLKASLECIAYLCLPLYFSAHLCLPLYTSAFLCTSLLTSAFLCMPLLSSAYLCFPLHTSAFLCLHWVQPLDSPLTSCWMRRVTYEYQTLALPVNTTCIHLHLVCMFLLRLELTIPL